MIVNDKALGSSESPSFPTTDTALAAWLVTKGIVYTHINHKPNPNSPQELEAEFVFPASQLPRVVRHAARREAEANR